jgi:hypothetical protein
MQTGAGVDGISAGALFPAVPAASFRPSVAPDRNVSAPMDDVSMENGARGEEIGSLALFPSQAPAPAVPVRRLSADAAHRNVRPPLDDVGMGNGTGRAAAMEGIHASTAGLMRCSSKMTGWKLTPVPVPVLVVAVLLWMCCSAGTRSGWSGWR